MKDEEGQDTRDGRDGQEERDGRDRLWEQLAGLPERFAAWRMGDLRLGRRIVYDVKANWKLIVLNFNEWWRGPPAPRS